MVKKLGADFKDIHPSMKLLSDPILGKYIDFYLVKDIRLPYHAFYSPLANVGVAELPHFEESTPMNWSFNNKKVYKQLFHNWFLLIVDKYDARKLEFKNNDLYSAHCSVEAGNIKTGKFVKVDDDDKKKLFMKKSIFNKIDKYFSNGLRDQWRHHKMVTGLPMSDWHPQSVSLFSKSEKELLKLYGS